MINKRLFQFTFIETGILFQSQKLQDVRVTDNIFRLFTRLQLLDFCSYPFLILTGQQAFIEKAVNLTLQLPCTPG